MSHQKGRLKNSKFWLCLSLILCLVSAIVASAVQTSGGIRIKEMSWESPSGHQLAAYLYIPQNATKDTPARVLLQSKDGITTKKCRTCIVLSWLAGDMWCWHLICTVMATRKACRLQNFTMVLWASMVQFSLLQAFRTLTQLVLALQAIPAAVQLLIWR